jgi:LysM repeat protein
MSVDTPSQPTKTCPTCGTHLAENATRCLVCGRNFTALDSANSVSNVRGARLPEITLSLPIAMGLMVLVLAIGAAIVFLVLKSTERIVEPTVTPTLTSTATVTLTATASLTPTPLPTATALPPVEYTVQDGDFCSTIAAIFDVSIQSIVLQNSLPADCSQLYVGQVLMIPQPTPTASPLPSATLGSADATEAACEKITYTVQANDTLSTIALNYNVDMDAIRSYNGLTGDIVFQGQTLLIPLCARFPTPGPTPTATLPPPYPAPNLLLPADGAAFMMISETITLQWASAGTLRQNEAFAVTIEDVTDGEGRKQIEYVTDTKLIVPSSLKPAENKPHVFRWWVLPVRQVSTTKDGEPVWDSAGAISEKRVFTWWGIGAATPEAE